MKNNASPTARKWPLRFPGALIETFNEVVEPIYFAIDNLFLQVDRIKEARDILLPRLMSGMIDVEELGVKNLESLSNSL